jgi:hypothetical protein
MNAVMPFYERRQVGRTLIFDAIAQAAIGLALLSVSTVVGLVLVVVAALTGWLFTSMTVTVTNDDVGWRFGPGLVERRLPLAEIKGVRVVRLPWYSGIGIHFTANGWLYNVASGAVVQLEARDGGRVNLGSPEPEALCAAIAERLAVAPPTAPGPHAHGMPWPVMSVILTSVVVLVVMTVVIWNGRQPVAVSLERGYFTVRGGGVSTTVAVDEITSVRLADVLPKVERRTHGFAFGDRLRGTFHLANIGPADLFVDADAPPFVVVRTPRLLLYVNEPTAADTRRLLYDLQAAAPAR